MEHRAVSQRWSRIANVRLLVFIAIAVTAWFTLDRRSALLAGLLAIEIVAVLALIALHTRLRQRRDAVQRLIDVNARALARLEHRWADLPPVPDHGITREHPFAWDLNVVGDASLLRRIGSPVTHGGWRELIAALTSNAPVSDVVSQQEAVRELAGDLERRQQVEAAGFRRDEPLASPEALLRWAEGAPTLARPAWLVPYARISPLIVIVLAVMQIGGWSPYPLWLIPLVLQVIVSQVWAGAASWQVRAIAPLHRDIAGYGGIFAAIEASDATSPMLRAIRDGLAHDEAAASIARLNRVCSLAIPAGTLLYLPFQLFLLWDVNVLAIMERWQRHSGRHLRGWLEAVAAWEARAALAILAHDHPGWSFAEVDPRHAVLTAGGLRHPLIPPGEAIGNDVTVGPAGTTLFVTGSNMSGKSTLLRAIGLNAVLARAGAPVAADWCRMPSLDVRCCMRVEDSVERGVSFFMAELLRLKAVVDAAQAAREQPVLYLLDEILQGTNTAERQIASRRVMQALAACHAIGAVSSHDLELFDEPELRERMVPVHFAEQFDDSVTPPTMHFDYRLRPGIATSTNALALMEMLGFEVARQSRT